MWIELSERDTMVITIHCGFSPTKYESVYRSNPLGGHRHSPQLRMRLRLAADLEPTGGPMCRYTQSGLDVCSREHRKGMTSLKPPLKNRLYRSKEWNRG